MECKICGRQCSGFKGLSSHITNFHKLKSKQYFDLYLKKNNEGLCKVCGDNTSFDGLNKRYNIYCSIKCMANDPDMILQKKKTNIIKYGREISIDYEKAKKTKLERYGTEKYVNKEAIQNFWKNISPEQNKKRIIKIKETCLKKYGVDNIFKYSEFIKENKIKISKAYYIKRLKYIKKEIDRKKLCLIILDCINKDKFLFKCTTCNNTFEIKYQSFYKRYTNGDTICTICNPFGGNISKSEKDLMEFIKQNYIGEIIENSKSIIHPYELDIYLPDLKLAFEFNGLFWHNELNVDDNYHLKKTESCEKQGIHLIHIYEDDWNYKQDIIKSRILNLFGKSQVIYARKCEIKEVDFKNTKEFLNKNHLQGTCVSKTNIGLYYNNELVSLMTFGGLRKNLGSRTEEDKFELLRFCNKLNTSVVGGANKLFKYFIDKYHPEEVISYADRSWTSKTINTLYDSLCFRFVKDTKSNYYYVIDGIRENRFKYRKDVLIKEGYDKDKSEHEIMLERKIYRIYDSGQLKYVWNNINT